MVVTELTASVADLVEHLAKLPGIGRKSAERIAWHLLRVHSSEAIALADSIRTVRENVLYCSQCFNLAEQELCAVCRDATRDAKLLCVVEQPRDLTAIEHSGSYRGHYHVLLGRVSPLDNIGPDQLTIDALVDRVREGQYREVIMATNPTVEGDGTALLISNRLQESGVRLSRLARGITSGSMLENTNREVLTDAISGRQPL